MAEFKDSYITEEERKALLIQNLADRPNAMSSYGRAKMSAEDLKKAFDDQFILVVNRHNLLHESVEGIRGEAQTERLESLENRTDTLEGRADTVDERLGDPNDANSIEDVIQRVANLENLLDDPENQETFQEDYKTLRTQVKSNATNTLANAGQIRYINDYLDRDPSDSDPSDSANIFLDVYPVGSIYMSVNPTDPAYLFGGSWVALKDRFLVGAGGAYGVKTEGGEATHTLTAEEMPNHSHGQTMSFYNSANGSWAGNMPMAYGTSGTVHGLSIVHGSTYTKATDSKGTQTQTNKTGDSQPHNNMPPYYAVYMWRREA